MRRVSYLLRVTIDDRPGSLGQLAVALGAVRADILSLEVIERGSDWAVDDIVVTLPIGALPDTLITAATQAGAHVDSVRPYAGVLDTHRELELVDHVATSRGDRLQTLVNDAPAVLRASWATVVSRADSGAAITVCGSSGTPETPLVAADWLPLSAARTIDPQHPVRTRRHRWRPAQRVRPHQAGRGAAPGRDRSRRDNCAHVLALHRRPPGP